MSKYDIQPKIECQNRILNTIFGLNLKVKIRYSAPFECQNRILNVKNTIFTQISNVKIGF